MSGKWRLGITPSRFAVVHLLRRCKNGKDEKKRLAYASEEMSSEPRSAGEKRELSPVCEIIQEHLLSRCRDGMCEACGAKHQQVLGERIVTSPGADDLLDNSRLTHSRR